MHAPQRPLEGGDEFVGVGVAPVAWGGRVLGVAVGLGSVGEGTGRPVVGVGGEGDVEM